MDKAETSKNVELNTMTWNEKKQGIEYTATEKQGPYLPMFAGDEGSWHVLNPILYSVNF